MTGNPTANRAKLLFQHRHDDPPAVDFALHEFIEFRPAERHRRDALLVLGNLAYSHWGIGLEGGLFSVFPVAWVVPITMAAAAIHYQPRLQIYVAAVYVMGLSIMAFGGPWMAPGETATV